MIKKPELRGVAVKIHNLEEENDRIANANIKLMRLNTKLHNRIAALQSDLVHYCSVCHLSMSLWKEGDVKICFSCRELFGMKHDEVMKGMYQTRFTEGIHRQALGFAYHHSLEEREQAIAAIRDGVEKLELTWDCELFKDKVLAIIQKFKEGKPARKRCDVCDAEEGFTKCLCSHDTPPKASGYGRRSLADQDGSNVTVSPVNRERNQPKEVDEDDQTGSHFIEIRAKDFIRKGMVKS